MKPAVFVIDGKMGTGKTEFAKRWLDGVPRSFYNIGPARLWATFPEGDAFADYDLVALDEVHQYEPTSARNAVQRLIAQAGEKNKQLVLVTQDLKDLVARLGLELPENTAFTTFEWSLPPFPIKQATFQFKGQELVVP